MSRAGQNHLRNAENGWKHCGENTAGTAQQMPKRNHIKLNESLKTEKI